MLIIGAGGLGSPIARVPGAGGRRQDRHRRLRHRRPLATCSARSCTRTTTSASRRSTRRRRRINAYNPDVKVVTHEEPLTSENAMEIIGAVRHHRQRRRQLRRALPGERRLLLPQEAAGRRLDPALRRPGDGVPAGQGLLPLPLPGAAAARHGAELRRGGRARRAVRHDRHDPGDRGAEADPRRRRIAARPAAALRRAGDGVPPGAHPQRPELRALRRQPDDHGTDRLRRVLRHARSAARTKRSRGTVVQRAKATRVPSRCCSECVGEPADHRRRMRQAKVTGAARSRRRTHVNSDQLPGLREQITHGRRLAAPLRQHLPQRRRHPLPAVARHAASRTATSSRSCPPSPAG